MGQPVRIARDARGRRTSFEDIRVGEDLGSVTWSFTREDIARLCESDDDFHEWYSVGSPYDGVIAPLLISYPPVRLLFSAKFNVRGLFYRYEAESYKPLRPDTAYVISGRIADKWVKRDREYVKYEATCVDRAGEKVFWTGRTHVLDYLTRETPKTGMGIDSGAGGSPDRDPRVNEGAER